jgi:hypothetical protein
MPPPWDASQSLFGNLQRIIEGRLVRPMQNSEGAILLDGSHEALAVLISDPTAHRQSLILDVQPAAAHPAVRHVWRAALDVMETPKGVHTVEAFVDQLIQATAQVAGERLIESVMVDLEPTEPQSYSSSLRHPSPQSQEQAAQRLSHGSCLSGSSASTTAASGSEGSLQGCASMGGVQISAVPPAQAPQAQATQAGAMQAIPIAMAFPVGPTAPPPGPLPRTVTVDELRDHKLIANKGPRPGADIMALANAIAREKLLGREPNVRALGILCGCSAGGAQDRAQQYATLIAQILHMPPPESIRCSSLPPSPPSTPATHQSLSLAARCCGSGYAWAAVVKNTTVAILGVLLLSWSSITADPSPRPLPIGGRGGRAVGDVLAGRISYGSSNTFTANITVATAAAAVAAAVASDLQCPAGWVAAVGLSAEDGVRCFAVPPHLGTHYECATSLCPAASGGGGAAVEGTAVKGTAVKGTAGRNASLATRLGSSEESARLLASLQLRDEDLWVGLFRASHGTPGVPPMREAPTWTPPGGGGVLSDWRWSSSEGEGEGEGGVALLGSWKVGQPDARFGREDCAYVSVATGEWSDYGCDLREFRCLCELGRPASEAYEESMAVHAEAMSDAAARQRVWAALVVGALFALPLFDTWRVDGAAGAGADGGERGGGRRLSSGAVRQLLMHVSVGMFFCGFAPFICQYAFGSWHSLQLGPYCNYFFLGCAGGFLLVETVPPCRQWVLSIFAAGLFSCLFIACMLGFWKSANDDDAGVGVFVCHGLFAAVLAHGAFSFVAPALRRDAPATPIDYYWNNYRAGSSLAFSGGLVVLLCFAAPLYMRDPDFARQHPFMPGTITMAFTWIALGLFGPRLLPQACTWLLGDASNERQLRAEKPYPGYLKASLTLT